MGQQDEGTITASWGFGTTTRETASIDGSVDGSDNSDRPNGISSATGLTATNTAAADAFWNEVTSNTLGAWDFGTASQPPSVFARKLA